MAKFSYERIVTRKYDDELVLTFGFNNVDDSGLNFDVEHPTGNIEETIVDFHGNIKVIAPIEVYGERELKIAISGESNNDVINVLSVEDAEDPRLSNDSIFIKEVLRYLNRHDTMLSVGDWPRYMIYDQG